MPSSYAYVCVWERGYVYTCACVQHCREFLKADQKIYTHQRSRERARTTTNIDKKRESACERAHTISVTKRERERDEFALPACMSSADLQLHGKNKTKQQVNLNWSVLSFFYNFLFSSALTCANVFLPPFVPNPLVRNSKGQKRNVIVCLQEEEHKTPNAAEAKALLSSAERRQRASWTKWRSSVSPTPIKMNARGNPQKKEGKMRIRAFPVSANNIWI